MKKTILAILLASGMSAQGARNGVPIDTSAMDTGDLKQEVELVQEVRPQDQLGVQINNPALLHEVDLVQKIQPQDQHNRLIELKVTLEQSIEEALELKVTLERNFEKIDTIIEGIDEKIKKIRNKDPDALQKLLIEPCLVENNIKEIDRICERNNEKIEENNRVTKRNFEETAKIRTALDRNDDEVKEIDRICERNNKVREENRRIIERNNEKIREMHRIVTFERMMWISRLDYDEICLNNSDLDNKIRLLDNSGLDNETFSKKLKLLMRHEKKIPLYMLKIFENYSALYKQCPANSVSEENFIRVWDEESVSCEGVDIVLKNNIQTLEYVIDALKIMIIPVTERVSSAAIYQADSFLENAKKCLTSLTESHLIGVKAVMGNLGNTKCQFFQKTQFSANYDPTYEGSGKPSNHFTIRTRDVPHRIKGVDKLIHEARRLPVLNDDQQQ
jgi:hypothetical protein